MYRLAQLSAAKHVPESETNIPQPTLKLGDNGKTAKWEIRLVLIDLVTNGFCKKPPTFPISIRTSYDTSTDFSTFIPEGVRFQRNTADHEATDITRTKELYSVTVTSSGVQHESSISPRLGEERAFTRSD